MTTSTEPSDEDLLRLAAAGGEHAFAELYRRRRTGVYRFALNMSGNIEVASEVTQEVFVCLIREAGKYDPAKGCLSSYLFGIARNQVRRHLERDRAYVALEDDLEPKLVSGANPLGDLTRSEAIESVRQAVLSLPPSYREVVVLCDLEEMSYADAADVLSVPVGTVRSRLNRGRTLLVDKLRAVHRKETNTGGINAMRCFA